jgi:betaine-aldehyde dehydrogenase
VSTSTDTQARNFIGGGWIDAAEGGVEDILNPATAAAIGTMAASTAADVDAAVAAAREALPAWRAQTPAARAQALFAVADRCQEHFDELARLEALDAGKPLTAVREEELPGVIDGMRFFAGGARTMGGPTSADYMEGQTSIMRREPVGVVAAITPWNYPLWQAVWKLAPAIATGNTVVLKPAETTPLSTARLVELAGEILPPGVLNLVQGHGDPVGAALAGHPDVDLVSFTGSVRAGRAVAHAAADGVKRVVMELGGNAPVLVFDDADLEASFETLAMAGLYNAGQECTAASRILVASSLHDRLVEGLAAAVSKLRIGDTMDAETELGPLNSAAHRDRVEAMLGRRPAHAELALGGGRPDLAGYYVEPTIVTGVRQDDELVREEIFGPVFTVQTFESEEEALRLGNDTRFGLAASVWTSDVGRAIRVGNQLDFGTVWINNHFAFSPELPVGGFGESGYGKEGSSLGVEEFTRVKVMTINTA